MIAGLWTALHYPALFLVLLVLFTLFAIWLFPRLWRGIKRVGRAITRFFGRKDSSNTTGEEPDLTLDRPPRLPGPKP